MFLYFLPQKYEIGQDIESFDTSYTSHIWLHFQCRLVHLVLDSQKKSNRMAMNRHWNNQKANPSLKTKAGNK